MFEHACKLGLEGVVSKVRDSAYAGGRGNSWVKKTCAQRETLIIAGFALDEGEFDGIYLGRRKAMTSSMPARWTTASTSHRRRICRNG
jgi:bifunctional non-homologous end joining protein LigD